MSDILRRDHRWLRVHCGTTSALIAGSSVRMSGRLFGGTPGSRPARIHGIPALAALGHVHRGIGSLHHRGCFLAVVGIEGDTDAAADFDRGTIEYDRIAERAHDLPGHD